LSFWSQKKSPWLIWVPASIFLGLGMLAKGPTLLVFFYGIALAVLWQTRNWRLLFHPAHFVALAIMLGIFAAWAVPFAKTTTMQLAMHKWSIQFTHRLKGTEFHFSSWSLNIPRALVYFLPWLLLLPLVRFWKFQDDQQRRLARALAWGIAVPFLALNLVPGAVSRYSMPYLAPASWLLAMSYAEGALYWPGQTRLGSEDPFARVVTAFVGLGLVIGGIGYPLTALALRGRQQVTRAAATINAALPGDEIVYAVNPRYVPVLFYVTAPLEYVSNVADLPDETHYFLVRADNETEAASTQKWAPARTHELARVMDYGKREMILFKVGP
jgi:4-amino-4-deoxy-L-arabinose transferase-like glycosyltransferase